MDNKIYQGKQSTACYPLTQGFTSIYNQISKTENVDDVCHLEGRRE